MSIRSVSNSPMANGGRLNVSSGQLPAGSVLQVVSTTLSSAYSESIAAEIISSSVVPGLTASITPVSTSSKIRIDISTYLSSSVEYGLGGFVFRRGSTAIGVADEAGDRSRLSAFGGALGHEARDIAPISQTFVDSPSSTSELTYGISLFNRDDSTVNMYINRASNDTDEVFRVRTISTITLMEVAG